MTTSFSGQDFKVLAYLPWISRESIAYGQSLVTEQQKIDELEKKSNSLFLHQFQTRGPLLQDRLLGEEPATKAMEKEIAERKKSLQTKQKQLQATNGFVVLDSLQTLSYQVHADKRPVRSLGAKYPRGFTTGQRLVAGSMIFTLFKEHPLIPLMNLLNQAQSDGLAPKDVDISSVIADQIPPLNLYIVGTNEMGNVAGMTLFGVEFLNDGGVLSVQDVLSEITISYVARDLDLIRSADDPATGQPFFDAKTGSSVLSTPRMIDRALKRANPFR